MNIAVILVILVLDACPLVMSISGSCCKVKSNAAFKFLVSSSLKSGVYDIKNFCGDHDSVVKGYCDAVTDGGGWLVVQRRKDGSVDFNRTWVEYEVGFGDLNGEFWYGLRPLHCLTKHGQWQLRIDFTFINGTKSFLFNDKFAVGPASSKYELSVSRTSGFTTFDPFHQHPLCGMGFTTKDRDNDFSPKNCALDGRGGDSAGGWWHRDCSLIYFNHQYRRIGIFLNDKWNFVSYSEIKIRPRSCSRKQDVWYK